MVHSARKNKLWTFAGSVDGTSGNAVPVELMALMRWILQGSKAATAASRDQTLNKTCAIISQTVMQEFKSEKQVTHTPVSTVSAFRRHVESPFAIGLSIWMYHNFRSQNAINILNNMCAGISYSRVTQVCSQIANAIQQNIYTNGVFVPHGIVRGCA